jgi:hypothetical protein
MVLPLLLPTNMIDMIFQLTVGAVLVLAVINTVQGVALLVRLAGHAARRQPQWGLSLWLPAFTSLDDIRAWLDAWRDVLRSGDPVLAEVRATTRTVISRHVYLALLSHTWAMAVAAIVPRVV